MIPAFTPVRRNTVLDPFRTFGSGDENTVFPAADKIPASFPPFIGLFDEKIRGKTQFYKGTVRAVFVLEFVGGFSFGDDRGVSAVSSIHFVNEAVFASRTYFFYSRATDSMPPLC